METLTAHDERTTTTETAPAARSLPELLSLDEVLACLRISRSTYQEWVRAGDAPPRMKLGKHLRFDRDKVIEWLSSHEVCDAASSEPAPPGPFAEYR